MTTINNYDVHYSNTSYNFESNSSQSTTKEEFFSACKDQNEELIKSLIKKGADIDQQEDGTKNTGLHYACGSKKIEIVKLFMRNNANVNPCNKREQTPLHFASRAAHILAMQYLIAAAKVDATDDRGQTPLHYACESGNIDAVEYLLANGAEINIKNKDGRTPLHLACRVFQKRHGPVIQYLINKKAKVNEQDNEGQTPLHLACERGDKDIVKFLLDHGADVNKSNLNKQTPLHLAFSISRPNNELAKILKAKGADINKKDNNDQTPLHYACLTGDILGAEFLLSQGAKGEVDNQGHTSLYYAILFEHYEVANFLRQNGTKLNQKDKSDMLELLKNTQMP